MQENGIKIDAVAGTSAGSIVASMLAMGYTTNQMTKMFDLFAKNAIAISPKQIFTQIKDEKGIKIGGLTSSYNIELAVKEIAEAKKIKSIKDVKMPISIPSTDLITSKKIVFTNMKDLEGENYIKDIEIWKAVRASSTFPCMYAPFEYEKYQLVDGGIFDNLPVEEAKKLGVDKVISVRFKLKSPKKQKTIYNITMQSLDLMTEGLIKESIAKSDFDIEIDLKDVKPFSMKKIEYCYEQGYLQTINKILKIKEMLKQ